jgi:hypothetical protein
MKRKIEEYEARARECVRLAYSTNDKPLREQILNLYFCYLEYVAHLRECEPHRSAEVIQYGDWCKAQERMIA